MLPADPLQVGTVEGEIAPEDLFNPILYKACSNDSFSLLESRILAMLDLGGLNPDVSGNSARVDTDEAVPSSANVSDFDVYYGLLSDAHGWKHANPQVGLTMTNLKPLVHEVLAEFGGAGVSGRGDTSAGGSVFAPDGSTSGTNPPIASVMMRGNAKPMPRIPTTVFPQANGAGVATGFPNNTVTNTQTALPRMRTMVSAIIVPPSRLHELFYRMVVEWTLEFSEIRTLSEIAGWAGLATLGTSTRFVNYDFGDSKTMDNDTAMVDTNVPIDKVM